MTDPTGRCFISYRRSRSAEVRALVEAHQDHGVPTWLDVDDLDTGPTEDQLRQVIRSQETASAVMWITPEVKTSSVIRTVEAPELFQRARHDDDFFLVPVAAGGLDFVEAAATFDGIHPAEDLRRWNLLRADSDPAVAAATVLRRLVNRRVAAIHRALPPDAPFRIGVYNRARAPFHPGVAFAFDWLPAYDGRVATAGTWDERLLPALAIVADAVRAHAPGREVEAEGLASVPAAVALGAAFLKVRGVRIGWRQLTDSTVGPCWSLGPRNDSGFKAEIRGDDTSAAELAVLVEVADLVGPALTRSASALPPFRAIITVRRGGQLPHRLDCSTAVDVAETTIAAIRQARARYPNLTKTHLFIAGPLALAMLTGQLLNTVGPVQTYEHIPDGGPGRYGRGCLITS